jgi:light-regulated signal transduction histidine kinase (bacteriophytochrome)
MTVRYVVEDNGVGFEPSHGSKLFRVFERLHTQKEFEGSGVGLCVVQRVLHRHDGDIVIEAQPGEGARVEFWLPRAGQSPVI